MRFTFILFFILFVNIDIFSQGCSDAGACSAGAMSLKDDSNTGSKLSLSYSQSMGLADKESFVLTTELTINHSILANTRLEIRLPYLLTIGNLATTSGVGDPLISLSQVIFRSDETSFSLIAGGRLKANNADKSNEGQPLPMVYQSSLGTYDLIAGVAWETSKWSISAGYQHAFGANGNQYLHPKSNDLPNSKLYFESAYLKRGADLLLRIQRTVELNNSNALNFGFLPICRMQADQIKRNGNYEQLPGSKGVTYNTFFNWLHLIDNSKSLNLSAGIPIHARDYRADGLTRTAIISATLFIKFQPVKNEMKPVDNLIDEFHPD